MPWSNSFNGVSAVLCLWPYDNNTGNRGQVLMKLKRWWPEKRSAGVFLLFHRWQARVIFYKGGLRNSVSEEFFLGCVLRSYR
ncbi:hypothetical protein V6N13_086882 [Hibiscus sabdariffa]